MTQEEIQQAAVESETFRLSAVSMSQIHGGMAASEVTGLDSVTKCDRIEDRMIALYDGYTEPQFKSAAEGVLPGEVGITGYHESHPRTGQPIIIYWIESSPAFRLEVGRSNFAEHSVNSMPNQLLHHAAKRYDGLLAEQAADVIEVFWRH